jgi:ferric-dicitrate binding protein FerR (iron transport regulator)
MEKRAMCDNPVTDDARGEIRAAHEAATWHQRLENGPTATELSRYFSWLKASRKNVEAMKFLERFCSALRSGSARNAHQ